MFSDGWTSVMGWRPTSRQVIVIVASSVFLKPRVQNFLRDSSSQWWRTTLVVMRLAMGVPITSFVISPAGSALKRWRVVAGPFPIILSLFTFLNAI